MSDVNSVNIQNVQPKNVTNEHFSENHTQGDFNIIYANTDGGMLNKKREIEANINLYNPSIIGLVETKPKNNRHQVQESEVALEDFITYHNLEDEGRGVCLYVHKSIPSNEVEKPKGNSFKEALLVECKTDRGKKTLFVLIYRSPNSDDSNSSELNKLLVYIDEIRTSYIDVVVLGDFNYPDIEWKNETAKNKKDKEFLQTTNDLFLIQHQKLPTRFRRGQKENTLDLVFTYKEELVTNIETLAPIGMSDHNMLLVQLNLKPDNETKKKPTMKYPKGDYIEMRKCLKKIIWRKELRHLNTRQAWRRFKEIIKKLEKEYVPVSGGTGKKRKGVIWMDKETLETHTQTLQRIQESEEDTRK